MDDFCKYHPTYSSEQAKAIAIEFSRLAGQYYLEHAGATLYSKKQLEEIMAQMSENLYANPHARNLSSKLTDDAVDILRYQVLNLFQADPQEYSVIFTAGATASLKLVAETFCYNNGVLAYLQDNHTSVLGMRAYAEQTKNLKIDEAFNLLNCKSCSRSEATDSNSLFVFPAQSNFNGTKYPLAWIESVQKGALDQFVEKCSNWFVALDAASFKSTNELDLSIHKPDFVAISFYKIFGYPTGLGALLLKNSSSHVLRKKYYGGGTVLMAQSVENTVIMRETIHERFEDGTIPFLSILALKAGFNTFKRLNLTFDLVSKHTFSLAQYVYRSLLCLHHSNGKRAVILYHHSTFESSCNQGAIVNFNLLRDKGEYVGYAEVLNFANLYNISLRTGCFCNPGACQHFLELTPEDVQRQFDAGHVCGDQHDLVDGYPTGSVRISFGYMSTKADADQLLEMIENCFVTQPVIKRIPSGCGNKEDIYVDQELDNKVGDYDFSGQGILEGIVLYPIKSCGGFFVKDKWPITSTGLKYDRRWMLINSAGVSITQKNNKNMCLIRPRINLDTEELILNFKELQEITIPIDGNSQSQHFASLCNSKVCGDQIQGWDCGDEVAEWLSTAMEYPGLRLLRQCSGNEDIVGRTSKKNQVLRLSLANQAQYLLINVSSVEWLRERIFSQGLDDNLKTTVQRFRPNFIVNFNQPFTENNHSEFVFGNNIFQSGGPCTRCQMICIDQNTGQTSKEPLQILSKAFKGKISFGVYLNREESVETLVYVGCKVKPAKKINV